MSGSFSHPYFTSQNVAPMSAAQWQQAYASALQRAAMQQAYMQQMQQQMAQQQALMQKTDVPGPANSPLPTQAGLPGPIAITGGGQVPLTATGVQGAVPFSQDGVPAPQPKAFSGAIGGPNAPGGAMPFQIRPPSPMSMPSASAAAQQASYNNPFALSSPGGTTASPDLQSTLAALAQMSRQSQSF